LGNRFLAVAGVTGARHLKGCAGASRCREPKAPELQFIRVVRIRDYMAGKSKAKFIIRWDDISRFHDRDKFRALVDLFQKYDIPAMLGVIPDNHDDEIKFGDQPEEQFVDDLRELVQAGWEVAQHGYRHIKHTESGGIWGLNKASEFAGRDYSDQIKDLRGGRDILRDYGFDSVTFVPPWHSYDAATQTALSDIGFRVISDGIFLYPRPAGALLQLPVIFWSVPRRMTTLRFLDSVYTICLHPHLIGENDLKKLARFFEEYRPEVTTPSALVEKAADVTRKNIKRKIFEYIFDVYYRRQG